jgi:hypothetical protein
MLLTDFIIRLRHIRILGMSSFELILLILIGIFVAPSFGGWFKYLIGVFALAIGVHWMLGVNTALNWKLGLSECPPNLNSLTGMNCAI